MHLKVISNGLGSASTMMLILACEGIPIDATFKSEYATRTGKPFNENEFIKALPFGFVVKQLNPLRIGIHADVSITADMRNSEIDRLWNTGERSTSAEYFESIIKPYAKAHNFEAIEVVATKKSGEILPDLIDMLEDDSYGKIPGIPTYGSKGGRNRRICTSKYKIGPVRKEMRRRGAKTASVALSLTYDEMHRMSNSDVQWASNWWPLIDLRLTRQSIQNYLDRENFPYLMNTECFFCPFQNLKRWERLSPDVLQRAANIENQWNGTQFLTPHRVPLMEAIEIMREKEVDNDEFCDTAGYCGDSV